MRQSEFLYKTYKENLQAETAKSANLLFRAGFIEKVGAGIYNFLPLGFRVLENIKTIIRQELNKIGAQEFLLTALQPKENWVKSGRWESFDVLFRLKSQLEKEYALGPTHEEIIFPLMKKIIQSYRDLPRAVYQIQTKFRDELRAKSGILRTREFLMKDLYSFHRDNDELEAYKNKVDQTYLRIFKQVGLEPIKTKASGGTFTSGFSTEFQVAAAAGEDLIYRCPVCREAWNEEVSQSNRCLRCQVEAETINAIEVGNTFNLGVKFSEIFNLVYNDKVGQTELVWAGCYGIGLPRVLGAIAETNNDDKGIIWPKSVAPFPIHLLVLYSNQTKIDQKLKLIAEKLYQTLNLEVEILYDDRLTSSAEKLAEADLIGLPLRLVLSQKSLEKNQVEFKERKKQKIILKPWREVKTEVRRWLNSSSN